MGFIPGMLGWLNTWKSTDVIYHTNKLYKKNQMSQQEMQKKLSLKFNICSW